MALLDSTTIAQPYVPFEFFVNLDFGFGSHINSYCPLCGIHGVSHKTFTGLDLAATAGGTPTAPDLAATAVERAAPDMTLLRHESRNCGRGSRTKTKMQCCPKLQLSRNAYDYTHTHTHTYTKHKHRHIHKTHAQTQTHTHTHTHAHKYTHTQPQTHT